MRISTRLAAIGYVTGLAMLIAVPVLIWSFLQFDAARQQFQLASEIMDAESQCQGYRDQYFLYHDRQMQSHWEQSTAILEALLRQSNRLNIDDSTGDLTTQIRHNAQESRAIFARIAGNAEARHQGSANLARLDDVDKVLATQMLIRDESIERAAFVLKDAFRLIVERNYQRLLIVVTLFAASMALATLVASIQIVRLTRTRMLAMHAGARRITGGDIQYRFSTDGGDEFSEIARMFNIVSDKLVAEIETRKKSADQLNKLSTAVEQSPDSIVITDLDANIEYVNPRFAQVTGYSPDEVIGQNPRILQSGQTPPETHQAMWAALTRGSSWQGELINKRKDGTFYWEDTRAAPVRNVEGVVTHYVGIKTDVTCRKAIERELQESNERYRFLFQYNPMPMLIFAESDLRILEVNDRAVSHYGYSHDEFVALTLVDIRPREDAPTLYRFISESLGKTTSIEARHQTKRGEVIDVQLEVAPMEYRGMSARIVLIEDITLRKAADAAVLRESTKTSIMLRNASDGIHILDYDGNVVEASDSFCAMLGYSREEVIGMNLSQWDAGFTSDAEREAIFRQQFESPVRVEFTTKHRRKDGSVFDVELSGLSLTLDGKPVVFNSSRDVTQRKQLEAALSREAANNRRIIRNASDGVHVLDLQGNVIEASDAFCQMLGYSREEVIGMNVGRWDDAIDPITLPGVIQKQYHSGERNVFETRHRRKDGRSFDVEISGYPFELDGQGTMFYSSRDVTNRKQAEQALRESEKLFHNMADNAPVLIWMADTDKLCNWFNKVWLDFTGRTSEQEMGNGWAEGVHPDDFERCLDTYVKAFDQREPFVMEYRLRRFDGEYRWLMDRGKPRYDVAGIFLGYIGSCTDIHDRRQMEFEIQQLAYYDSLTKLPNRRLLADRLQQAVTVSKRKGKYAALMMLDLDNFKPLNDQYGHAAGDLLLIEVAQRLKRCVRESDTVARLGGDEFVVLLGELTEDHDESRDQAAKVANKVLTEVSLPYSVRLTHQETAGMAQRVEHHCTASIGVMMFNGMVTPAEVAMECADKAMYNAKESGRSRVRFYDA